MAAKPYWTELEPCKMVTYGFVHLDLDTPGRHLTTENIEFEKLIIQVLKVIHKYFPRLAECVMLFSYFFYICSHEGSNEVTRVPVTRQFYF